MRALLVVDVQEDFTEGGSLGVEGGHAVAAAIPAVLASYALVVASTDWHVDPGDHFSDHPDFAHSWPPHCVVGTDGSHLQSPLTEEMFAGIVRKGEHSAAYSAFDGTVEGVPFLDWLRDRDVDELDVCGIATDQCVRASVLDARRAGLGVRVLTALIAGVAPEPSEAALREMAEAGVVLV